MNRIAALLFLLIGMHTGLMAQVFPKENSKLNYRLVGFSFPAVSGASGYTIELANGNVQSEAAFAKNVISTLQARSNKLIAEVPAFGREYTWCVTYKDRGVQRKSPLHHFSVIISSATDTSVTRLQILTVTDKYKDAHVFMDGSHALYDMKGNPVWYVPVTDKLNPEKSKMWDMKLTPQGTITFLLDQNIYEINYTGDVLWQGPNNGIEYYHHEFTRLGNGHYVVAGTEFATWDLAGAAPHIENDRKIKNSRDSTKEITAFGTVIEYGHDSKVLWSWKSSDYFKTLDPKYLKAELYNSKGPKKMVDVHENAFYFDEHEQAVYVSFKNISTIIKVKYPEGTVSGIYGTLGKYLNTGKENICFCGQHSPKISDQGYLYLYNNNACTLGGLPRIMKFQEPKLGTDTLKEVWEYDCPFDMVLQAKKREADVLKIKNDLPTPEALSSLGIYSKGGNIVELPSHDIFASICGIYGAVFIVSPEKKIKWSAILETWNQYQTKWDDVINYKSNIITDPANLEKLIWNSENK